ncbi:pyrimidine (deoxy)nucleoside triphosphate diphosphatase [Rouxiella sp. T17]|uniref:pyrimidine (deoxy)nucleoside triphosphate diphosphatase n=1 Tax=Rouxiella sp. T17 TaxID=3085684 RepID=UPI002FC6E497
MILPDPRESSGLAITAPIEVVAAIIERGDHILLARRDENSDQAGLWEFPGGKVEAGETQAVALRRELLEELNIDAQVEQWIASNAWQKGQRIIELHALRVSAFSGELALRCHSETVWVTAVQARDYDLAPADVPLLEAYITFLESKNL